jgi:hypothetical protein
MHRDDSLHNVYNPGYRQAVSRVWRGFGQRFPGYSVLMLVTGRVREFERGLRGRARPYYAGLVRLAGWTT